MKKKAKQVYMWERKLHQGEEIVQSFPKVKEGKCLCPTNSRWANVRVDWGKWDGAGDGRWHGEEREADDTRHCGTQQSQLKILIRELTAVLYFFI